jgi:hypothetical protein
VRRSFTQELEEDREVEIGGQIFKFQYPHWKEGAQLFDEEMTQVQTNGDAPTEVPAFSFVADTETAIKRVPMFLDPENDSHKRWKELVARKPPHAVPRHQIAQFYRYLVEVTSGFPTTQLSGSSSGAGSSDSSSLEGAS